MASWCGSEGNLGWGRLRLGTHGCIILGKLPPCFTLVQLEDHSTCDASTRYCYRSRYAVGRVASIDRRVSTLKVWTV